MTASAHDWDSTYRDSQPPPWDIGRPQPAFLALAEQGRLAGDLLDAGCGTGEHALLAASRGARATGVDLSPVAVERAREKAVVRGLSAEFSVGDILDLPLPARGFDVVLDSGLFHSFDREEDRVRYVDTLAHLLRSGGTCYLMCFSDRQPGDWGPRRVTRAEIERAFSAGWQVDSLEPAVFDLNPAFGMSTAQAWLAAIRHG